MTCLMLLSLVLGVQGLAPDWPQVLGPGRNGVYAGPPLNETWGASGPRVAWRRSIGQGLSGPVVAQNRLILFHRVGDREVILAVDAASGKGLWEYGYPTSYRDDFGFDEGPRAVPVVANGVVYTFGAEGQLHAVGLATGKVRFQRPWRARQAASVNAATAVINGDLIFLSAEYGPGAGVLRLDGSTLTNVWASDDVLSNHYATSVYAGGVLYGFHGRQEF